MKDDREYLEQRIYEIVVKCFDKIAAQHYDTLNDYVDEVVEDVTFKLQRKSDQITKDCIKKIDKEFFY